MNHEDRLFTVDLICGLGLKNLNLCTPPLVLEIPRTLELDPVHVECQVECE